jgi:hypothetical protein
MSKSPSPRRLHVQRPSFRVGVLAAACALLAAESGSALAQSAATAKDAARTPETALGKGSARYTGSRQATAAARQATSSWVVGIPDQPLASLCLRGLCCRCMVLF